MKTNFFSNLCTLFLIGSVLLISCNDKQEDIITPETPVAVQFRSGIQVTKASDDKWDMGDKIGIYMTKTSWGIKQIVEDVDNRCYLTSQGDGIFSPAPAWYRNNLFSYRDKFKC